MSSRSDFRASLNWFVREGLPRHALEASRELLRRRSDDAQAKFWVIYFAGELGKSPDSIAKLTELRKRRETDLACTLALIHFHKRQKRVDRDELERLQSLVQSIEDTASDASRVLAAHFCALSGDHEHARRMLTRVINSAMGAGSHTALQAQACALNAWNTILLVHRGQSMDVVGDLDSCWRHLDHESLKRDLEGMLARACCLTLRGDPSRALDHLNQAIALQPDLAPALLEKAKLLARSGHWDQAADAFNRVLAAEPMNLIALKLSALARMVQGAPAEEVLEGIKATAAALEKSEPENVHAHLGVARLFARFASSQPNIVDLTTRILQQALDKQPRNSELHSELAFQSMLGGQLSAAAARYREAAALDESNVEVLYGAIHCQVLDNELDDADQQLEFLKAIQDSVATNPHILYLEALLAWRKEGNADKHCSSLSGALNAHFQSLDRVSGSASVFDYFIAFDPRFLLDVVSELLVHAPAAEGPQSGVGASGEPNAAVKLALQVLGRITADVPGLGAAHILSADALLSTGQLQAALRTVQSCLALDASSSRAHILSAQISLAQGNTQLAHQSLEQALSYDFGIRSTCSYNLVKARVLRAQGELDEAVVQLEKAMQIPGVRDGSDPRVTIGDRAGVFVELVGALSELSRFKEAHRLAKEAKGIFRGTGAELQVVLAESELAVRRHEIDSAIQMLNKVPSASPAFARAQAAKAEIYLMHRHDRRAYAQCYQDLVEARGDSAAYIQLGDAFMRIQAPENAVDAFEKALKLNPSDSALAARIGRALVSTHDYKRAIDYYSGALSNDPESGELRLDLSRLFLRLNRLAESLTVLQPQLARIDESPVPPTTEDAALAVQALLLLADIHKQQLDVDAQQSILERAHRYQKRLAEQTKAQVHGPEAAEAQREALASICCTLGGLREEQKDDRGAETWLREALSAHGTSRVALEALCNLHFRRRDYDACRRQCEVLERIDTESALAQMLLADILFIERKDEEATAKYKALLKKHPNHYRALRRLVTLLERAGQLPEAAQFLQRAEKANPRAFSHAGLNFCRGMFHRAGNNVSDAIRFFNFARRDGEWGPEALANMIELYLNPENDNTWATGQGLSENHTEDVRTAERFFEELRIMVPSPLPEKFRILELYILLGQYQISTRRSEDGDRAILDQAEKGFIEILEEDRENIPATLGLSTVFLLSQNQNKARNMLKRIAKSDYNQDQSREFERTYLHLVDIYVEKGKNDVAIDLCKKALEYNKSCEKAWEYIGIIHEKELSYKDAAEAYEKAWECASEASASIGFRLAFNYLKARRFVEAIDVCNKVLKQFPHYPKMKEEILDKAVQSLRP